MRPPIDQVKGGPYATTGPLSFMRPPIDQVKGDLSVDQEKGGHGLYTITWPVYNPWPFKIILD